MNEQTTKDKLDDEIPAHTQGGLERYRDNHCEPGGFLYAVLTNNLRLAVRRADSENLAELPRIVTWIFHNMPTTAWGDEERYRAWINNEKAKENQ